MFFVAHQCRMCEKSQNENAASATVKFNRGKSRVRLTRVWRKVVVNKSKNERKKKVERSRDDSGEELLITHVSSDLPDKHKRHFEYK